jgi:hypothetical protein
LDTVRRRFPAKRHIALVFASCSLPVHIWSVLTVLWVVPAWMPKMDWWELTGAVAYTLAFALLESLGLAALFALVAALVPAPVVRERFAGLGTMLAAVTVLWAFAAFSQAVSSSEGLPELEPGRFALLAVLYLALAATSGALVIRWDRLNARLVSLAERVSVLAYIYLFFDMLGLVVIAVRNIQGSM